MNSDASYGYVYLMAFLFSILLFFVRPSSISEARMVFSAVGRIRFDLVELSQLANLIVIISSI